MIILKLKLFIDVNQNLLQSLKITIYENIIHMMRNTVIIFVSKIGEGIL